MNTCPKAAVAVSMLVPSRIHAKYQLRQNAECPCNPQLCRVFNPKIAHSILPRPFIHSVSRMRFHKIIWSERLRGSRPLLGACRACASLSKAWETFDRSGAYDSHAGRWLRFCDSLGTSTRLARVLSGLPPRTYRSPRLTLRRIRSSYNSWAPVVTPCASD